MSTVVTANEEQQEALLNKHLKAQPRLWWHKLLGISTNPIVSSEFEQGIDKSQDIGYVTLYLRSGKCCWYQLRDGEPSFVEFRGFDSRIRYDVNYPKGEMYEILKTAGEKARDKFWKGGEI